MTQLQEGLKKGDLNNLILPMLSIDEFDSKIDNRTVIVVAFYCFEEDPAHDLSNFIERSPTNPLDTDVSPAPSKEGYYLTFVELKRNPQFVERLMSIVKEVSNLTNVQQWQFTSVRLPKGKVLPLTAANVRAHVDLKPQPLPKTDDHRQQQLKEFLQHSCLDDFVWEHQTLCLQRGVQRMCYADAEVASNGGSQPLLMTESAVSEAQKLQRMLDGPYAVYATAQGMVVEHQIHKNYLILHRSRV